MTKFTDHIHSEILNIAEKNLNSDQSVSYDNFDNILNKEEKIAKLSAEKLLELGFNTIYKKE